MHVYRITDRRGTSWPMLTREPTAPPADGSLRVELVATNADDDLAWETFERLIKELRPGKTRPGK